VADAVAMIHDASDAVVASWMRAADAFLCMSEHEGMVPIIEAFYVGLPVVAFAAGAVPQTMGEAGVLFDMTPPRWRISSPI
jgi:glycosyltransferase involved in cell wall biosynthesis